MRQPPVGADEVLMYKNLNIEINFLIPDLTSTKIVSDLTSIVTVQYH